MTRAITITAALLIMSALVGGMITFAQSAKEPPTELYVRTVPDGAAVLVDGEEVGTSDNLFEVEPGARKIAVELRGYEPGSKDVTVAAARIKRVVFEFKKRANPPTENLLTNPGAENGGKTPDGWKQGAAIPGVEYSWDKKVAFEGKASLCIEKKVKRYFPIATWSQTVERKGDASALELSAQIKARKMTKAILDVVFLDKNDRWISHKWAAYIGSKKRGQPPATHHWKKYSGKVDIPPGTVKLLIGLQVYGPGKVWFDDVRVKEVKEKSGRSTSQENSKPADNPRPMKTHPKVGATDVSPNLKKIRVTFDRDMKVGSHSWCGGGPHFPEVTGKPKWLDRRTCVLPVKLEKGKAYRLALNWGRFQNFRSADGKPATPTALYFCTRGASSKLVAMMTPPKVVKLSIANGAKDVPPGRTKLSVTFDQPMGGGMSWCTRPDTDMPKNEPVKGSAWSADKRTCSIYALLEPGRSYTIYLNDERFGNFMNQLGVSLKPTAWKFTTSAAGGRQD